MTQAGSSLKARWLDLYASVLSAVSRCTLAGSSRRLLLSAVPRVIAFGSSRKGNRNQGLRTSSVRGSTTIQGGGNNSERQEAVRQAKDEAQVGRPIDIPVPKRGEFDAVIKKAAKASMGRGKR